MDIDKGIKLEFRKSNYLIQSEYEIYDSSNRVPFSLKIDFSGNRPTSIYCEISDGEDFIELWFDKQTKRLYEITIVSIQANTIQFDTDDLINVKEYYECYIDDNSELIVSESINILRSEKSLCFYWGDQTSKVFKITKNCILGVDVENKLCSISLVDLSKEAIFEILGF